MPFVWSAETYRRLPAVRTAFIGVVSDIYRGEYGDVIASAIKSATSGHPVMHPRRKPVREIRRVEAT